MILRQRDRGPDRESGLRDDGDGDASGAARRRGRFRRPAIHVAAQFPLRPSAPTPRRRQSSERRIRRRFRIPRGRRPAAGRRCVVSRLPDVRCVRRHGDCGLDRRGDDGAVDARHRLHHHDARPLRDRWFVRRPLLRPRPPEASRRRPDDLGHGGADDARGDVHLDAAHRGGADGARRIVRHEAVVRREPAVGPARRPVAEPAERSASAESRPGRPRLPVDCVCRLPYQTKRPVHPSRCVSSQASVRLPAGRRSLPERAWKGARPGVAAGRVLPPLVPGPACPNWAFWLDRSSAFVLTAYEGRPRSMWTRGVCAKPRL